MTPAALRTLALKAELLSGPDLAFQYEVDQFIYEYRHLSLQYGSSIDVSAALVPKGCEWLLRHNNGGNRVRPDSHGETRPFAHVYTPDRHPLASPNPVLSFKAYGATPALALLAAALKMRAHLLQEEMKQ